MYLTKSKCLIIWYGVLSYKIFFLCISIHHPYSHYELWLIFNERIDWC